MNRDFGTTGWLTTKRKCPRCGKMRGRKTCYKVDSWGAFGPRGETMPFCVDCITDDDRKAIRQKQAAAQAEGRKQQMAEKRKGWRTVSPDELIEWALGDEN